MTQRTYPYKGWVLQPSFKPVEVELVRANAPSGGTDFGDHTTAGKWYAPGEIHLTKETAIAAGWATIKRLQADLDKRTLNHKKKRAALTKAAENQ